MSAPTSQDIVKAIQGLCDRVTTGPDAPVGAELAATLGTVKEEARSAVYVEPASPPFSRVIVSREPDGTADNLTLLLAEPNEKLAASLAVPLGAPAFPPVVGGGSFRAVWSVDLGPGRSRTCAVSVTFAGVPNRQTLAGSVTEVGIRIDPRL